jgi:uncharacterized protein
MEITAILRTSHISGRPWSTNPGKRENKPGFCLRQYYFSKRRKTMQGKGYHEPIDQLNETTRDMHRAIMSLMEELEAVDWYNQRIAVCQDRELEAILEHNRDEEKEHAAMVMEWIRRKDPTFDEQLKNYLFTDKSVARK